MWQTARERQIHKSITFLCLLLGTTIATSTLTATLQATNTVSNVTGSAGTASLNASVATSTLEATTAKTANSSFFTQSAGPTTETRTTTQREHTLPPPKPIEFLMKFRVKYDQGDYNKSLESTRTDYYIFIEAEIRGKLVKAFNNVSGLPKIEITGFWHGSLGTNFTAKLAYVTSDKLREELKNVERMLNCSGFNESYLREEFNDNIEEAVSRMEKKCDLSQSDPCGENYACDLDEYSQPVCRHLCSKLTCLNGGYCAIDTEQNPVCRCPSDEKFIYEGSQCHEKSEKLKMSKESIIGISVGVGGGIILILAVTIIIMCVKKRISLPGGNKYLDNSSEQSFKSFQASDDGIFQPIREHEIIYNQSPTFRLSEERASDPRFNPYMSEGLRQVSEEASGMQHTDYGAQQRQSERSRSQIVELKPQILQIQSLEQSYGSSAQSRLQGDPLSSDFREIKDTKNKSIRNQPKLTMRPLNEARVDRGQLTDAVTVYDYTHHVDSQATGSSYPHDTSLYDFNFESRLEQERRITDPYSIKGTLVSLNY